MEHARSVLGWHGPGWRAHRRENVNVDAASHDERLGLGGKPARAIQPGAPVQRVDPNGVPRSIVITRILVEDHEGEVAVEHRGDIVTVLVIEMHDGFAVGIGAKPIGAIGVTLEVLGAELLVVVDLAVHRQRAHAVVREKGLVAREWIDNGKPFMCQRGAGSAVIVGDYVNSRTIGTAVTHKALQRQRLQPQGIR
jgi:hypothetical protein